MSLPSLPRLLGILGLAGLVLTPTVAASPRATGAATMVQLTRSAACSESVALSRAGAREIDARLRLWRLEPALAESAVPALRARHALIFAQRERTYRVAATVDTPDPLQADEWWLSQIGISGLTPPGPGVPVTIVDSGLDVGHPEFLGRPDTQTLNEQEPAPFGGEHGTMVSSVIAAPVNGVGLVGIYPRAILRSWDAAKGDGTRLESSEISAGLLAAARAGRSVINLSLGSDVSDLSIELAVDEAVASGSLVVAASGNDGDRGSPLGYPAAYPHVTTVGATDRNGAVAAFSSRSHYVDLAAPGDGIIVASALGQNWQPASGTSFSSPMVAAAAAWIWTARPELTAGQVAEILRRSATDIAPAGRDQASGFGMLNVAAALALPAPIRDTFEPNDDIDQVDPNGDRYVSKQPPLSTVAKRSARIAGRIDRYEDPRDVFRVWLPGASRVTATLAASSNGDLALYSTAARSVVGRFATDGRLTVAASKGSRERLVYVNRGKGRWAYLAVQPGSGALDASYTLAVASGPIASR
ncbi:MAG TPA: S8 family serine peptidase [Gaiella sp.]|nr:S8 family serine peptidase [Gaiella sp.]